MKISYKWLSCYFDEKLPAPEKLAELLTFRFAEIESVETFMAEDSTKEDTVFDLKVLPDRACYGLSHRGVAKEISATVPIKMKEIVKPPFKESSSIQVKVENKAEKLCTRYVARYIENVKVGATPDWPKLWLEAIGARSINNVVDATNTVMLDMGQPLHAFDADKVKGGICIRLAKKGEQIILLDGREVALNETDLIIADEVGPLAIAGIKGGKRAEVTIDTKNLILESACFDPVSIRKTSTRLGIKNDSSKRFENGVTPHLTPDAMYWLTVLILEMSKSAKVGPVTDIHTDLPEQVNLEISVAWINSILGTDIKTADIIKYLNSLDITTVEKGDKLILTIPHNRLDLRIPQDIAEEVGRLYGYENIKPIIVPKSGDIAVVPRLLSYSDKIRDVLIDLGFSEIFTSSFRDKGDIEIEKSLASDKNFMRTNIGLNMSEALTRNIYNADLLGLDEVKIFEIGKVFPKSGEHSSLTLGIKRVKKTKGVDDKSIFKNVIEALNRSLSVDLEASGLLKVTTNPAGLICEINLDELLSKLPDVMNYKPAEYKPASTSYKKISPYPFIVRDIALFVPENVSAEKVWEVIFKAIKDDASSDLIARHALFDTFKKDGKVSYAFRIVFQSMDETLTDGDTNDIMEKVYFAVKGQGWEVR